MRIWKAKDAQNVRASKTAHPAPLVAAAVTAKIQNLNWNLPMRQPKKLVPRGRSATRKFAQQNTWKGLALIWQKGLGQI